MSEAAPSAAPAAQPNGAAPKPTAAPAAAPPMTAAEKRRYELTVDGQKETFEGTDEDVQRELQIGRAGRKRLEEAKALQAKARREQEEFAGRIKSDTRAALEAAGIDVDEWLANELARQVKAHQLTPEQRELEELRAKAKQRDEDDAKRTKAEQEAKANAAADAAWAQLEPQFMAAIEAHPELPRTKGTMRKLAAVGLEFAEAGLDLTPAQIAAEVAKREGETNVGRIRKAPLDILKIWLTKEQRHAIARDVSEEIRAGRRAVAGTAEPEADAAGATSAGQPRPTKGLTTAQLLAQLPRRR